MRRRNAQYVADRGVRCPEEIGDANEYAGRVARHVLKVRLQEVILKETPFRTSRYGLDKELRVCSLEECLWTDVSLLLASRTNIMRLLIRSSLGLQLDSTVSSCPPCSSG